MLWWFNRLQNKIFHIVFVYIMGRRSQFSSIYIKFNFNFVLLISVGTSLQFIVVLPLSYFSDVTCGFYIVTQNVFSISVFVCFSVVCGIQTLLLFLSLFYWSTVLPNMESEADNEHSRRPVNNRRQVANRKKATIHVR